MKSKNRLIRFFIALYIGVILNFSLSASATNKEEIASLYLKTQETFVSLPYSGELIFRRYHDGKESSSTIRIVQKSDREKYVEVVSPESIKGFVFLNKKDGFWQSPFDDELKEKFKHSKDSLPWHIIFKHPEHYSSDRKSLLLKNYGFKSKNGRKIAGHHTQKIYVIPEHKYRFSIHMWIESDTNMLLKQTMVDCDDKLRETYFFKEIKINDISNEFFSTKGLELVRKYDKDKEEKEDDPPLNFQPLKIEWLPRGFVFFDQNRWQRDKNIIINHTVYSDGLARLSIFQRKQSEKEMKEQKDKHEDEIKLLERHGRSIYFCEKEGLRIYALGDLPSEAITYTLKKILRQPKRHDDKNWGKCGEEDHQKK